MTAVDCDRGRSRSHVHDQTRRFYDDFLPRLRGLDSFVFAAACQTAITTKWERIKLVAEICREYGGRPG